MAKLRVRVDLKGGGLTPKVAERVKRLGNATDRYCKLAEEITPEALLESWQREFSIPKTRTSIVLSALLPT